MAIPKIREQIEARVKDTGDIMTGLLTLSGNPTADFHAATKKYVDDNTPDVANAALKLTTNAGSSTLPVYFADGIPKQCNTSLGVSITGNAATATKATQDGNGNVITSTYLPLSGGTLTGDLEIKNTGPMFTMTNSTFGQDMRLYPAGNSVILLNRNVAGNSTNYRALYLHNSTASSSINSALVFQDTVSGTTKNYNVLHAGNYNNYAPTKTGSGASGTWGISISGNAATVTKLATARTIFGIGFDGTGNVSGKPLVHGTYTSTAANRFYNSGIEVRENGLVGNTQSDIGYAPSIGFHWSGKIAASLLFHHDGNFYLRKQDGTTRATLDANLNGNAATATKATQDGNGATIASTYLKLTGGTMTGYLTLGNASTTSTVPAAGIRIPDLRECTPTPGMFGDRAFNIYFDQAATGDWQSIIHVKGWTAAYVAYELAGPAGTNNYNQGLYYRAGVSGSWQCGWKKLWMSGDSITVPAGTDYTTYKARNIAANTSPLTSGSSSLTNGYIYVQYE